MNTRPVEVRFWEKVQKTDCCWIWLGNRGGGDGGREYGRFHKDGKNRPAHRVAWELMNGPMPDGLFACHRCDNPLCVRPDHVFAATQQENMHDASIKGRTVNCGKTKRAFCKRGHVLDEDNSCRSPNGSRRCRACVTQRNERLKESRRLTISSRINHACVHCGSSPLLGYLRQTPQWECGTRGWGKRHRRSEQCLQSEFKNKGLVK